MNSKKTPKATAKATAATKEERKAEQMAQERALFELACIKKGITPTTGPKIFNVSRPTFWAWMKGKHRIPHKAFMQIIQLLIEVDLVQYEREQELKRKAAELNQTIFTKPRKIRRVYKEEL